MPDHRRHRGPHPEDAELFGAAASQNLQTAAGHLAWLLDRGYPQRAALELVGNRFALRERQRVALRRCSCDREQLEARSRRRLVDPWEDAAGTPVWIDGFNVLTTVEAALGGGVLLVGRDRMLRDMASMHGTYRRVEETGTALQAIVDALLARGVTTCRWLLDAPVSNSGRLKVRILELAADLGLAQTVDLVDDPDRELRDAAGVVVATADAGILDGSCRFCDLASAALLRCGAEPWVVDLSGG